MRKKWICPPWAFLLMIFLPFGLCLTYSCNQKQDKCFLLFIIPSYIVGCNTDIKEVSHKNKDYTFIDSLKNEANNAIINFYIDFLKSKIEVSDRSNINSKNGLDTIFRFIGNLRNDSCSLSLSVIPDGEISFYKDTILIAEMQFVLADSCRGFYIGFGKNSRKFNLTLFGDTTLIKLKRNIFKGIKVPLNEGY